MTITCLIIDDEKAAREGLTLLLNDFPEIRIIGHCKNGVEAIDQIQALKPDLILLDIQMPLVNGFEVLASIPKPHPKIIFITAYDEFALKAFEVNAIDYLLKPFSDERFAEAINRAKELIETNKEQHMNDLVQQTRSSLKQPNTLAETNDNRLVIKSDGSIHLVKCEEIIYVEAFDYYVKIHVNNRFYLLRETMKNMESKLPRSSFCRIHKSSIVNLQMVSSLEKQESGDYTVLLKSGNELKVSRSYRASLRSRLGE
ncbi:MAG: LytTR family DNA-binding domain-containing protein [Marinoscillum sp.]